MHHRITRSTLFPYTTLFRSLEGHNSGEMIGVTPNSLNIRDVRVTAADAWLTKAVRSRENLTILTGSRVRRLKRSEEHTSELQSHVNLVCRLLLEKKNLLCRR